MTTVYMIVTRDKYRLPRWGGTTTAELAQLSGRKYHNVRAEGRVRRCVWRLGGDLGETFRRYYENKWGRD